MYSISALSAAAAAGLFAEATALQVARDSLTDSIGIAGTTSLYVALIAGLASLTLTVIGLIEVGRPSPGIGAELLGGISSLRLLLAIGFVALAMAGAVYLGAALARWEGTQPPFTIAIQSAFAVVAAIFAAAFASLPIKILAGRERHLAITAGLLVAVGISGELAMGIVNVTAPTPLVSSPLGFGGWPLINLNLPFGAAVALGAFLLWSAYRRLSHHYATVPAPPRTM